MITKVTSKGQVTLPKQIREELGIEFGDFIDFQIKDNMVIIKPIHTKGDLMDLKGILKAGRSATDEEIKNAKNIALKKKWIKK